MDAALLFSCTLTVKLTEGLHRLDQFQREGLVFGQLFKHAGDLVVSRPHDVASVNALDVVAHTDDLHPVHHTALFDALSWRRRREENGKQNEEEKCHGKTAT